MTRTCPTCSAELEYVFSDCGDGDDQCDCDEAYDCPGCGDRWMVACGAHVKVKWRGRATIDLDTSR